MLPNVEFDANFTALVYFQINQPNQPVNQEFKLLGGLSLAKQSAIYKIKNNTNKNNGNNFNEMMLDDIDMDNETMSTQEVLIGISIEPNEQAETLLRSLKDQQQLQLSVPKQLLLTNSASSAVSTVEQKIKISNKIIENCYNYLSSFEDINKKVPIAKFNEWWKRYIQKLENNPHLLEE